MATTIRRTRPRSVTAALGAVFASSVLAVVAAMPAVASANDDHSDTQKLLNQYQAHAGPGAAVLAGNASGSWSVHRGTGTVGANKPIQPVDSFRIASQTKTFTAVAVLQLRDKGKVNLDAPIEKYLPGVVTGNGYDGNKITTRNLLQHRTGIPTAGATPKAKPDGTYDLTEQIRAGLAKKPLSEPGTKFNYSNTNYLIAGLLVEKLTGKEIPAAITDATITPLGLSRTKFPKPGDRSLAEPYARGYAGGRLGPVSGWLDNSKALEPSLLSPAGAMVSTLQDVVKFERALIDGKQMSAASLAEMRKTVTVPGEDFDLSYGLGLMRIKLTCGGYAWGHGGDTQSWSSITMTTDDGRYASLVTNTMVTDTKAKPTRASVVDSAICGTR